MLKSWEQSRSKNAGVAGRSVFRSLGWGIGALAAAFVSFGSVASETTTVREYSDSGVLVSESQQMTLDDGTTVLHGTTTTWYDTGVKASEQVFEKDVPNGSYKEWHENGNIKLEATFVDGAMDGMVKIYHENGTIKTEYIMNHGVREGEFTTFFENGEIETVGQYEGGKPVGEWASFSSNGESFVYEDTDEGEESGAASQDDQR